MHLERLSIFRFFWILSKMIPGPITLPVCQGSSLVRWHVTILPWHVVDVCFHVVACMESEHYHYLKTLTFSPSRDQIWLRLHQLLPKDIWSTIYLNWFRLPPSFVSSNSVIGLLRLSTLPLQVYSLSWLSFLGDYFHKQGPWSII